MSDRKEKKHSNQNLIANFRNKSSNNLFDTSYKMLEEKKSSEPLTNLMITDSPKLDNKDSARYNSLTEDSAITNPSPKPFQMMKQVSLF